METNLCKTITPFFLLPILIFLMPVTNAFAQPKFASDNTATVQLFQTIRNGDAKKLKSLLQNGADANAVLEEYSALMAAALNGNTDEMKLLLKHGANVNYYNKDSISAIWLAVPDYSKTTLLLQHGADAKAKSSRGYTTLMFLAMSEEDDPDMTQALIDHGALPAAKAKDHTDALYYAKLKGNTKSVALLTKYISK